jgi:hypothetical protein
MAPALGSRRIGAAASGRRVLRPLARPITRLEPAPLRFAPGLRPAPHGGVRLSRRPVRAGENMKAQLKCSNCGAEITNVNMSWGRRQWLYLIPLILFMTFLYPIIITKVMKGKAHDFRTDLVTTFQDKRYTDDLIEIIGTVENHGTVDWRRLTVEAQLHDKDGKFLDQILDYISITVPKGGKETIMVSKKKFPQSRWEAIKDIKLRVTEADYDRF